jgi:HTH-type transcriptional regulator / antitoxin HigA
LPDVPPVEVLRFLMEQHDLRQSDLPEIGSQGVVSDVKGGASSDRQFKSAAVRLSVPM